MNETERIEHLLRQAIAFSPDNEMLYLVGQNPDETICLPFFCLNLLYFRQPPFPEAKAMMYARIIYGVQCLAEAQQLNVSYQSLVSNSGRYSYMVKLGQGVGSSSHIKAIAWLNAYVDHLQRSSSRVRQ